MSISCFLALVVEILHSAIYGMNHYTVDKVLGKQYYYYMYAIHLIEINFIPNYTVCFQSFFVLDFPFFQIILNILGLVHWWMADFKQVPDTVLYDGCSFN